MGGSDREDEVMVDTPAAINQVETEEDLDILFPNRPRNHSGTLAFHDLVSRLFEPLVNPKPKAVVRGRGPHRSAAPTPHQTKIIAVERFISLWRQKVGDDIYPAFRLIVPLQDRDRAMYGLKESKIASILVKVMGIPRIAPDAQSLLKWKLPSRTSANDTSGDFAARCYEVFKIRHRRSEPGNMTISEVNERLDRLSLENGEGQQKLFLEFYQKMSPIELQWLVRIILRQMKVGATERTLFNVWHPDAQKLFGYHSNLREVCWELYDPEHRIEVSLTPMKCFGPQLAEHQMRSIQKVVDKMLSETDEKVFWIEEKLDGERIQMHMVPGSKIEGGRRFGFWSRKGKDYTYLYGHGLYDNDSAMTQHLKEAFEERVHTIVLDGEMITWDPEVGALVPFGTLKSAALDEQRCPSKTGHRPLFRIFDILYLNNTSLVEWTLRDRRKALQGSVRPIKDRFEIHKYVEGQTVDDIDSCLREVIVTASEGLVVKNPRSAYEVDQRNDDWVKVKPEYMTEYGESMDCLVLGGYYGSGRRGGRLSSFLCGVRADKEEQGPMKFYSFFKVGGGIRAGDYRAIYSKTEGKWKTWDPKKPPTEFIELGGAKNNYEEPDMWIRPDESIVLEVKATSIVPTDKFRVGWVLRFPRFTKLRDDRDWSTSMSLEEFMKLKSEVDKNDTKELKVDDSRKKRQKVTTKKPLRVIGGGDEFVTPYNGAHTDVFKGLNFYIMTSSSKPNKMSKEELEQLVKANGGSFFQTHTARPDTICVADRFVVQAAARKKDGVTNVVRPLWLIDCVKQAEIDRGKPQHLLPFEPKYMLYTTPDSEASIAENVDQYGDSYAKDVTTDELHEIFSRMPVADSSTTCSSLFVNLEEHDFSLPSLKGFMFHTLKLLILPLDSETSAMDHSSPLPPPHSLARFSRATLIEPPSISSLVEEEGITHVVIGSQHHHSIREGSGEEETALGDEMEGIEMNKEAKGKRKEKGQEDEKQKERRKERHELARRVRVVISSWKRLPRIVGAEWIEACWREGTRVDEEAFAVV